MADMRRRDVVLERQLTATAAQAANLPNDRGLGAYADHRAHPGGVRPDLDAPQEVAEELADARNYCVWGIEQVWQAYMDGDADAAAEYARLMRCLTAVTKAWHELHT